MVNASARVKTSGGSSIRDARRKLRSIRRGLGRKTKNTARRSAQRTVFDMKEEIVSNDAVASTELFRSFRTFTRDTLRGGSHSFETVIVNDADHAPYVEFGTGFFNDSPTGITAYKAPTFSGHLVGQIQLWLLEKPALRSPVTAGSAFAIAHAIAEGTERHPPGTPQQQFFLNTWRMKGRPTFIGRMRAAVKHSV